MSSSLRPIRDLLILVLWGSAVLWLSWSGQLTNYINPSLKPYSAVSGVLLLILALFALRALLGKKSPTECCHDHHHEQEDHCDHSHSHEEEHEASSHHLCEHDHQHGNSPGFLTLGFKTLLLLLPLGIILFGNANHYTLSTIQNRGVVQDVTKLPGVRESKLPTPSPAITQPVQSVQAASNVSTTTTPTTTPDSSAMPIQVIDLLYAVQMPSYREEFEGKQVEMIGQFVPLTTGNPKGDRFQAIRLFITCCAADAKPVGVTVQYDKPLKVGEMSWVKITGTATFPLEGGKRTAILVASKVEDCPAPEEPFVQ